MIISRRTSSANLDAAVAPKKTLEFRKKYEENLSILSLLLRRFSDRTSQIIQSGNIIEGNY